jgi:DNA topoisomerase-1
VTFNEITKKVVQESIRNPRAIDMDLVDAQQARRILDRIVGYKLSPLLWRKVRRGLSAGRVQSVATRMIVDREEEIRGFQPEEYWLLDADLSRVGKPGRLLARFHGRGREENGAQDRRRRGKDRKAVANAPFAVKNVKRTDKKRSPSPPFSPPPSMQERRVSWRMTPQRTMSIAQQLYEGAGDQGGGHGWPYHLYAYRRLLRISAEALAVSTHS